MKIGPHGDVISSNLNFGAGSDAKSDLFANSSIFIGEIQKVYTNDDTSSQPEGAADFTLCDVMVYRSTGGTEIIKQCRIMHPTWGGGVNNFLEHTYPVPDQNTFDPKKKRSEKSANQVILSFINGNKQAAIILGAVPHTSQVAKARRPKKDKGTVLEAELQGLNWQINNEGEFTLTFYGPRDNKGKIINDKAGPTSFKIDKKGDITITTAKKQTIKVDTENQKIQIDNGPTQMIMDGKNDKITHKAKVMETLGSESNRVHGKKVKISKSATSEPSEPFVLGNKMNAFLEKLLTAIATHTHTGNLGVSTTPPINMSEFEQMKSSPVGSKDLLSDFIKGEK